MSVEGSPLVISACLTSQARGWLRQPVLPIPGVAVVAVMAGICEGDDAADLLCGFPGVLLAVMVVVFVLSDCEEEEEKEDEDEDEGEDEGEDEDDADDDAADDDDDDDVDVLSSFSSGLATPSRIIDS